MTVAAAPGSGPHARAAAFDCIAAVGDIDMQHMHDEYAEAVQQFIEAKVEQHAPPKAPRAAKRADAGVTDLMSALQAATEQARASRGEDADVHHIADRKPAKKTVKKAGGKKAAAKKTTRKRAG